MAGVLVVYGTRHGQSERVANRVADVMREEGLDVTAAVLEAGRARLRPILMTTSTTVLALVPLALGWGAGAGLQAPLARVVVGGLLASSLVTLFLVPALYVEAAARTQALAELWRARRSAAPAPTAT